MNNFEYVTPRHLDEVPELLADGRGAILAGGTDLLDRMKERIEQPERVINIKGLRALHGITHGDGLKIGALTTIAQVAADARTAKEGYRVLAEAAGSVATPQLRNMGTLGGNLCQRPRCWYFRSIDHDCLKKGGHTCFAYEGRNKYHALFGGGPCFIVHPSDTAPALVALGAEVEIHGARGKRRVALDGFFQPPEQILRAENSLRSDEVLSHIHVPEPAKGTRSTYLKFREKQSLDFAISSVAAVLRLKGDEVRDARLVLGGVAPIPWRVEAAEQELKGKALNAQTIDAAADAAVAAADPLSENGYKVTLTRNLVRRALTGLTA